jgi:ABC-2 type transport system permease protein
MRRDTPRPTAVYASVARLAFQRSATYRIATIGGVVANTVVAFLLASVLLAAVSQRGQIRGLDATAAVTFTFLVFGLESPVGIYQGLELTDRIRSGDVAVDLYRPFDLQLYWLADNAGRAAYATLTRLAPPVLIGGLFFDLRIPRSLNTWMAFAASALAAIALSYAYRFAISLSGFWVLDGRGVQSISGLFVMVFSGFTIPIQMFPSWIGTFARALPFAALAQLPAEVFLDRHPGTTVLPVLARQLAWVAVFAVIGRALLARATARLVVQGG